MILKLIAVAAILQALCFAYDIRRYDRLPKSTKPISYNLHFCTNVHEGENNFNGTIQIRIEILEDTDRIILHAVNMEILKLSLVDLKKNVVINNLKYKLDNKSEQMIITGSIKALSLIATKEYLLTIHYRGSPCLRPKGFCTFWYKPVGDASKRIPLATAYLTQGNARLVFPCYDQPKFKANFTISITHGFNYTALSNMPRQGDPVPGPDGYVTTSFSQSPPMSPHRVSIAVSNYENLTENVDNIEMRLFFKPKSKGGRLAFEVSKKAFLLMKEYFNVSVPLPKIDHFSVPGMDTGIGNWGLITYPEPVLLDDVSHPERNSESFRIVTTEMARMWFGNLVNPIWWSQNWLSESISTFYGLKFINLIKPDLNLTFDKYFLRYSTEVCSLNCNAKFEWEYDSIFGKISSTKGAFVISMFEELLTEQVFRKGIIKYLQKYQFSIATEDDLFECLADSVQNSRNPYFKDDLSLKNAMKSWSTQKYYPLVIVIRNYEKGIFTLRQVDYQTIDEGRGDSFWWIPITFTTSKYLNFENITTDFIFPDMRQMEINPTEFEKPLASEDWLILNKEISGLYRVNYDERNWELITCALLEDPTVIPENTKIQMIQDLLESFVGGYVKAPVLFNFLSYLQNETNKKMWIAASNALVTIFNNLKTYEDEPKEELKKLIENIISNASQIYNSDENSEYFELSDENRLFFELSCNLELKKCDRIMDIIYKKRSSHKITIWENSLFFYGSCHIYKHASKEMRDFIDEVADTQNYDVLLEHFFCTKSKEELKAILITNIKNTDSITCKLRISSLAMNNPNSLKSYVELLEEGDPELQRLFLHNAISAIRNSKTREQKDLLVKTWKSMGYSLDEGHYYGINKKFKRHDKIRERMLEWFKTGPVKTTLSC